MAAPELRSSRLLLRHWRPEDRRPFASMNADPQVMEYEPPTLSTDQSDLLAETIQLGLEARDYGLWAVQICDDVHGDESPFIGFVGLSVPIWDTAFTPCVEIGWRLSRPYWGFGYATEAAAQVFEYGFNVLRLDEILSLTSLLNSRSMAVMQRLGMTRNENEDFNHPNLDANDALCRHALFRMSGQLWARK
ncbi:MAG: GNAT family N-acetyltransferase [Acidimicrobiales bacterium]|nr:GNAT family N-acetyltransferase [Acidimicrobiales bacterium]MDP6901678.1 GNAT family N-acetyltransferase [Acidimicrobiales bacterium]